MEPHTTDIQLFKKFASDNVGAWATIDIVRRSQEGTIMPMEDEDWCDLLGYSEESLGKIINAVKSRKNLTPMLQCRHEGEINNS